MASKTMENMKMKLIEMISRSLSYVLPMSIYVFTGLCLVVYCETYSSLLHRVFTGKFTRSSRVMTPSLLVSSSSNEAVAIAASTYQTQQMVNAVLHRGKSDRKSSLERTSMSFCFLRGSAQFLFQES